MVHSYKAPDKLRTGEQRWQGKGTPAHRIQFMEPLLETLKKQYEQEVQSRIEAYFDLNDKMLKEQEKKIPGSYAKICLTMESTIRNSTVDSVINELEAFLQSSEFIFLPKTELPYSYKEIQEAISYFESLTPEYQAKVVEEENYVWIDEGKGNLVKKPKIVLELQKQEKVPCQCSLCKQRAM